MRRFPFLAVIIVAALIAASFLFLERVRIPEKSAPREDKIVKIPEKPKQRDYKQKKRTSPEEHAPALLTGGKHYRQVAIIIDDIGFDLPALRKLAEIPAPIAFAILPFTPHAAEAAEFLHKRNREILLHLPMEPLSYPKASPGAGALMTNMDEGAIIRQLRDDLAAVPHVSGANNHMGSRFTEDERLMKIVMGELRERGFYFVDSRTSPHSRAREAALQTGVRFAERNIFIDHNQGYGAAIASLREASGQSRPDAPPLLLIGHPHADTTRAIKDMLPLWEKEGIRVVDVKTCLTGKK